MRPHIPEEELHAYADDALSSAQRAEIAEHMLGCLICRAFHAEVMELRGRASALLAIATPVSRRQRAVAKQVVDGGRPRRRHLVAAAVALVGIGTWASFAGESANTPSPKLATAFVTPAIFAGGVKHDAIVVPAEPIQPTTPRAAKINRRVVVRPKMITPQVEVPSRLGNIAPTTDLDPTPDTGWERSTLEAALEAGNGFVARLEGLPIAAVRMHRSADGERPTFLVRHRLPDGRQVWVVEGTIEDLKTIEPMLEASGLTATMPIRTRPDYAGSEASPVHSVRMLTVAAYLPVDSLDALKGKIKLR